MVGDNFMRGDPATRGGQWGHWQRRKKIVQGDSVPQPGVRGSGER